MKRLFDTIISLIMLLMLSPFFLVIALLIRIKLGKPVLFIQKRPGKNEEVFHLYKFRTMTNLTDNQGELLHDEQRLTKFGVFLRKYSLDEIPQLLNVVKGDISLVGPRPLLIEYLPLYTEKQKIRHQVKPGITGWAQINGRNTVSWEERFEMDRWYVENRNWKLDIKILLLTVLKVLKKEGITQKNHVTMEKFTGSKEGH